MPLPQYDRIQIRNFARRYFLKLFFSLWCRFDSPSRLVRRRRICWAGSSSRIPSHGSAADQRTRSKFPHSHSPLSHSPCSTPRFRIPRIPLPAFQLSVFHSLLSHSPYSTPRFHAPRLPLPTFALPLFYSPLSHS
jgi:hypothetical protein